MTYPMPFLGDLPDLPGAVCAQVDTAPFFPEHAGSSPREAKLICSQCPARLPCLQWALDNFEAGVWGGTTERERRTMRRGAA